MTAATQTLADFLLACIAEDEAKARAAIDPERPGTHWQWAVPNGDTGDPDAQRWLRTSEEFPTASGVGLLPAFPLGFEFTAEPSRGMAHIANWDPARVLAECEAKRRIVARCKAALDLRAERSFPEYHRGGADLAEEMLLDLALPYADREGYREEWRP